MPSCCLAFFGGIFHWCLCAGAGAFEVAAAHHLRTVTKKLVQGRAKLGIEAYAEALMGFPKILAENSGHDAQVWGGKSCVRWGEVTACRLITTDYSAE